MSVEATKTILYWGGLAIFLLFELRFSYRPASVSKLKRWLTNLPLSVVNGILYHLVYFTAILEIIRQTEAMRLGLFNAVFMPGWLELLASVMILDFVIYIWHLLNHEVPLLWRFHRVHHSDMNMDASTANRFHLGELLLSGLLRLAVLYAFGISFLSYIIFEILVNLSIQFHHSGIRINPRFEEIWINLFTPPSMHRLHHSVKIKERDSNYGVIFSLWDRFCGTMTWGGDQDGLIIGIGSHRNFDKLGFLDLWLMPFTRKTR